MHVTDRELPQRRTCAAAESRERTIGNGVTSGNKMERNKKEFPPGCIAAKFYFRMENPPRSLPLYLAAGPPNRELSPRERVAWDRSSLVSFPHDRPSILAWVTRGGRNRLAKFSDELISDDESGQAGSA